MVGCWIRASVWYGVGGLSVSDDLDVERRGIDVTDMAVYDDADVDVEPNSQHVTRLPAEDVT